jgi:Fe-S cluster biogenesis protein NfuA
MFQNKKTRIAMDNPIIKSPVMFYTEVTPNPETMKFVTNRILYRGTADFRERELAETWSPLSKMLFELPYVKGVYICNNFVTVTKEFNYDWREITLLLKEKIKSFVEEGGTVLQEGFAEAMAALEPREAISGSGDDAELSKRIKDLIDTYVKPAVEGDGGNIEFKSFYQGTVTVILQGSCSGCPSSTVTLKSGIEGMLRRMIPEVQEVVSEME